MLKLVGKITYDRPYFFYKEYLYQTNTRYYRVVCERKGDMYSVFVNDSRYGEKSCDEPMYIHGRRQKASTIKEMIDTYESEEVI